MSFLSESSVSESSDAIAAALKAVRARLEKAELEYERVPRSVQLLAVSKTRGPSHILAAYSCGQRHFAENYLQEALDKMAQLPSDITWHFIGPIQSNKTRPLAEHFDWVHTIEREKIAQRLDAQRPAGRPPLNVLLQVNVSGEASKSGVSLAELPALAAAVVKLPNLKLRGLMTIPAPETDFAAQRHAFRQLARARDLLVAEGFDSCTDLSMGMSQDMEAAVAEGATMVRIGTDIFGMRA